MARVTVQRIADELGISKFAVSRALSGKHGVSDQTRRLVVEKAAELGYVVRTPRTQIASKDLEIIFHDPDVAHRELWVEVQAGVQQEGARQGFATAVRLTDDAGLPARLKESAAGFILVGPQEPAMIEAARGTGLPCVRIGPPVSALDPMDQVGIADLEAMSVVAQHLLDLGHRSFVYVHGQAGYPGRTERLHGFAAAIAQVEGTSLRELTFPEDSRAGDFRALMDALLSDDFQPTAFFCGNDNVAVTVISELLHLGIKVPEQVSVMGFADYPIATLMVPRLSTVRAPHREMGAAAVQIIKSRLVELSPADRLPPMRLNLVGTLVARDSTAEVCSRTRFWSAVEPREMS